eukprot:scaffold6180_cov194-Alexandrium_tamarense.AAC.3
MMNMQHEYFFNASTSKKDKSNIGTTRHVQSHRNVSLDECGRRLTPHRKNGDAEYAVCSEEHRRAVEFCSSGEHNLVLDRADADYRSLLPRPLVRPYSLTKQIKGGVYFPQCQNVDAFLQSIKLGQRHHLGMGYYNNTEIEERGSSLDSYPSKFVPGNCFVPLLPPSAEDTCNILNQFSHVIFHGDSLTRHLRQAMYMSMRGDYTMGGIPTTNQMTRESCVCDGQFSENALCRTFDEYFTNIVQPSKDVPGEAICRNLNGPNNNAFFFGKADNWGESSNIDWDGINCTREDYRGVLLFLQGGLHFKSKPQPTFDKVIEPVITHPKYQECLRRGKILTIWSGLQSISPESAKKYPHQSRENALLFNEEIFRLLHSRNDVHLGTDLLIVDWLNMTADAQSSDGVHYLTDVNLAKAAQILYIAEQWQLMRKMNKEEHQLLSLSERDGTEAVG